ncbi:MAG: glycosyl transferase [Rhodobiaceae bacterium]|nr:MAG: glycosyl transferase [Rhodobiaceae bacterium]
MKISIIIPTLNEAHQISDRVRHLRQMDGDCEVIVVDAGSEDETVARAADAGARMVISDERGRGAQLRLGASKATGDVLVFLHADTHLPSEAVQAIRRELENATNIGGNFRIVFDGPTGFAKWLTGFYAWFRSKGLYYGDSVMFLRRSIYEELGGIMPYPVMEDYDLGRKMEAHGGTVCIEDVPVITSSRRFRGKHPVWIFLGWCVLHGFYYAGLSTHILGWVYDTRRRRTASR